MTSKEALEELRDKAQLLALFMGKDAGDYLVNVDTLYNTSKQDLERLEALEKENKKWREIVGHDLCEALGREILLEENEKLKKAIEILNDAVILPMENDIAKVDTKGNNYYRLIFARRLLTEQEYELLKEVLGE